MIMINRDLYIDLKISVNLKNTPFLKIRKKKKVSMMILCSGFYYSIMHEFNFVFMYNMVKIKVFLEV